MKNDSNSVEDYLNSFPDETQYKLKLIRKTVKEIAPRSIESISYGMPSYKMNGKPLVYFGGFDKHIGLYPTMSVIEIFKEELAEYVSGKGSVQFPIDKPLPLELIDRIIRYRLSEIDI